MSREFELKLRVPQDQRQALEDHLVEQGGRAHRLDAHYFDTPQGELASLQASLRVRCEDDRWYQTLKIERRGAADRFEDEVELGCLQAVPVPDLARHRQHATARRLIDQLGSGIPALSAVAVVRTRRCAALIQRPGGAVEVSLDDVDVQAQGRTLSWHEVEFERKSGPAALVFALADEWLQRHPGLWIDPIAKGTRAARLARGQRQGPVCKAVEPAFDEARSAEAVLQAMTWACLRQILHNGAIVADGSEADEAVHQLRVGIRRLRVVLRELPALSPRIDPDWEGPLRDVLQGLGQSRDPKVRAAEIEPRLAEQGAPLCRLPAPDHPPPRPADLVVSPAFQSALLRMVGFSLTAAKGAVTDAADGQTSQAGARLAIRRRLSKLHRQVVKAAHGFEHLPAHEQHHERKRLKRLRYLAELSAPLFGRRQAARYLKALKPAQDVLGQHNDEAVALIEFEHHAQADPRAWFAVGWLKARLEASANAGRQALKSIDQARRFWKR